MAFTDDQRREFRQFEGRSLQIFRGVIIDLDKQVTGTTLRSLEVGTVFRRNSVVYRYRAVDTFKFRMEGRRPGTPPPIAPIEEWVERKNLDISPYAIQQNIANFGTTTPPVDWEEELRKGLEPDFERFTNRDQFGAIIITRNLDQLFNSRRR